jgi:hypothetical protein
MFRRRPRRRGKTAAVSLAKAEADLRQQQRKQDDEQPVRDKLERVRRENDVARLLRAALGGGNSR